MYDYREPWKQRIAAAIDALVREAGGADNISPAQVIAEIPPEPEMGDIGFPMFAYAKILRKGPPQIAQMVCERLKTDGAGGAGTAGSGTAGSGTAGSGTAGSFEAAGPYVNVRLERAVVAKAVLAEVLGVEVLAGDRKSVV